MQEQLRQSIVRYRGAHRVQRDQQNERRRISGLRASLPLGVLGKSCRY
jgi:hypothetical protein